MPASDRLPDQPGDAAHITRRLHVTAEVAVDHDLLTRQTRAGLSKRSSALDA